MVKRIDLPASERYHPDRPEPSNVEPIRPPVLLPSFGLASDFTSSLDFTIPWFYSFTVHNIAQYCLLLRRSNYPASFVQR